MQMASQLYLEQLSKQGPQASMQMMNGGNQMPAFGQNGNLNGSIASPNPGFVNPMQFQQMP